MSPNHDPNPLEVSVCPPEVLAVIAKMEAEMRQPAYNNAGFPCMVAVELVRAGAAQSFRDFEEWLRSAGSRVHLIAVPLNFFGPDFVKSTRYPWASDAEPEHSLWVGVNGPEEVDQILDDLGMTAEENRALLDKTGVLFID